MLSPHLHPRHLMITQFISDHTTLSCQSRRPPRSLFLPLASLSTFHITSLHITSAYLTSHIHSIIFFHFPSPCHFFIHTTSPHVTFALSLFSSHLSYPHLTSPHLFSPVIISIVTSSLSFIFPVLTHLTFTYFHLPSFHCASFSFISRHIIYLTPPQISSTLANIK